MFEIDKSVEVKILEEIEALKESKIYKKNQYIYHQGESAKSIYFLKSGAIKTISNSLNGDERIVFILREKGIFAASSLFTDKKRRSSAIALSKSEIIEINEEIIASYINKNPIFAFYIIKNMSRDINLMFDQITSASFLDAKKRIAFFLINFIKNNNFEKKDIKLIKLTQDDISKMVGISRPTVNKSLAYFAKNNWIELKYKSILVLKYQELKLYVNS